MRTRRIVRGLAVTTAALVVALLPGPASAAPNYLNEHFRDSGPGDNQVCVIGGKSVTFSETYRMKVHDLVKPVLDETGEAFLGKTNFFFRAEHENLTTGETFTVTARFNFREATSQRLPDTYVPPVPPTNQQGQPIPYTGPFYRFTAFENVNLTVVGERGLVLHERARLRYDGTFALGEAGPPQPGGVLLVEEITVLSGKQPTFDFCTIARAVSS